MIAIFTLLFLLIVVDAQAACKPTSATTQSCSQELSWTWTAVKDATGFVVQRKIDGGAWSDLQKIPLTARTLVDVVANDPGNRTISYQIMFYTAKGRSLPSNTVGVVTPGIVQAMPLPPTNLTVK